MDCSVTVNRRRNIVNTRKTPLISIPALKFSRSNQRTIMKAVLLSRLHFLFCDLFHNKIRQNPIHTFMECYTVDNKIIQFLIQSIIDTGEYTLEGIAHYTRIPFDVIFDAACGNNSQLSITLWVRVVHLYMQVRPDIAQLLFEKIKETNDKDYYTLTQLLNVQ